jgi:peptidoglycan/LPS O-acetylase OafA/YrhL
MSLSHDRINNFDLLRLIAAFQVVLVHGLGHTGLLETYRGVLGPFFTVLEHFPGVPVFFVMSGFLIAMSWDRSKRGARHFFWKRWLRIYPGLFASFMVTLLILFLAGHLTAAFASSPTFAGWVAGQLTVVQFFNPAEFRSFGTGVANAALWTIGVELQFYLCIPVLFFTLLNRRVSRVRKRVGIGLLFMGSAAAFIWMQSAINSASNFHYVSTGFKLLHNTILPHLWMFLIGVVAYFKRDLVNDWLSDRFVPWFVIYLGVVVARLSLPISLSPLADGIWLVCEQSLLGLVTISAAFSARNLSHRLLRGRDISYGVYIYHYLVINVLVEVGFMTTGWSVPVVFVLSGMVAYLSWTLVERPALALKARPPWFWRRTVRGVDQDLVTRKRVSTRPALEGSGKQ